MGFEEIRMSGDVNSEHESKSSEKANSKDGCDTDFDKMQKYIGVAFAGAYRLGVAALAVQVAFSGISCVEGVSTPEASGSALVPMDSKGLTDQRPSFQVAPDQRANCIEGLPERKLSQDTAGSSDPDGTNKNLGVPNEDSPLRKLWPHLAEDIDKWAAREGEQASKGLHQGEGQETPSEKTPPDLHSKKITPSEKAARIRNGDSITRASREQKDRGSRGGC